MCAGPFISLLLSRPDQVQRLDGVRITLRKTGWKRTLVEFARVNSNRDMLMLFPLFFTSWFYGSYVGTLQTQYMNIRTRSLCAFVIPFFDMAAGFITGYFLDRQSISIKQRARGAWGFLMVFNLALWFDTAILYVGPCFDVMTGFGQPLSPNNSAKKCL